VGVHVWAFLGVSLVVIIASGSDTALVRLGTGLALGRRRPGGTETPTHRKPAPLIRRNPDLDAPKTGSETGPPAMEISYAFCAFFAPGRRLNGNPIEVERFGCRCNRCPVRLRTRGFGSHHDFTFPPATIEHQRLGSPSAGAREPPDDPQSAPRRHRLPGCPVRNHLRRWRRARAAARGPSRPRRAPRPRPVPRQAAGGPSASAPDQRPRRQASPRQGPSRPAQAPARAPDGGASPSLQASSCPDPGPARGARCPGA
jgi:hypothetical protein